ncbi:MAG: NfeD family protein [Planctomycetota bacterium]
MRSNFLAPAVLASCALFFTSSAPQRLFAQDDLPFGMDLPSESVLFGTPDNDTVKTESDDDGVKPPQAENDGGEGDEGDSAKTQETVEVPESQEEEPESEMQQESNAAAEVTEISELDSEEPNEGLDVEADAGDSDANREADSAEADNADPDKIVGDKPGMNDILDVNQLDLDPVLQRKYEKAILIDVQGPIYGRFYWYLNHRLDLAKKEGCDLVIVRLTSPGGYVDESIDLGKRLAAIDWATTIVWIPKEAISGGAIISLGGERIYMKEDALIGDAGPLQFDGTGQFRFVEEKIASVLATAVAELAESRERPAALAEAMVIRKLDVVKVKERATGKTLYLKRTPNKGDGAQQEELAGIDEEKYEIIGSVPETLENRFLTLGAERATELGIADGSFDSEKDLLTALNIGELSRTEMVWQDKLVYFLNLPIITGLLLVVGLIALYLELVAPGISVAGMTAMLCFGLFFWSHALGGTSGWLEVMLFVLGLLCLACEVFVVPGFGVFGITGLGLVIVSLMMASQGFLIPESEMQWEQFQSNSVLVLGSVLGVLCLVFVQVFLLDSIPGLNRFKLVAPVDQAEAAPAQVSSLLQGAAAGLSVEIGAEAVAESDLRPSGKILVENELLDVITEGDYVEAGTAVEVIRIEGNRIIVRAQRMT